MLYCTTGQEIVPLHVKRGQGGRLGSFGSCFIGWLATAGRGGQCGQHMSFALLDPLIWDFKAGSKIRNAVVLRE